MSLGPGDLGEPARDLLEQLVAGVVTEAVVDLLEPVEVDEQQRENLVRALRARQGLVETVAEQRAVGEAGEAVVEGLARELLLEPDPLGDVARVEHHAPDVAVLAQVGHVRLEMPPLLEAVRHPEDQLPRLPVLERGAHRGAVVGMHDVEARVTEEVGLRAPEHRRDGLAHVAAPARVEHEHEVGRVGDEAAEVGRLAPGGRDQDEGEQQRDEQPGAAEHDLERDQVGDVAIGAGGEGPGGVERDVRGERGEHPQALDGVGDDHVLVGAQRDRGRRPARQHRGAGRGQVRDEAPRLGELRAHKRAGDGRQLHLVVVAVDRGSRPAREQHARRRCA